MDINKIKIDNNFKLIEASAGTGKSFTLAHILIRGIIEKRLNPEDFLLLSFTKNTCNELRTKIIERLEKLKEFIIHKKFNEIDSTLINWYNNYNKKNIKDFEILGILDNFYNNIYKLNITTFHGFCNKISEDYCIEISSTQGTKIENDIDELYQHVINEIWIEEYWKLETDIIKAIDNKKISTKYSKKNITRINKSFLFNILKDIDQENICNIKFEEKYKDIKTSIYLKQYLQKNWKEFCFLWKEKGESLFNSLKELGKLIVNQGYKSRNYSPNPKNKIKEINDWINYINKEIESGKFNIVIKKITNEDLLSRYFYCKNYQKEIENYKIDLDLSFFEDLQERIYNIKDGFYNELIRILINKSFLRLKILKDNNSILNFNDLIRRIENHILNESNNSESIIDLKEKYKFILIDEFQDTDQIQWNIISLLFKDHKHFLLCVGDPKQAIYKFRGGDIHTYLKAKKEANEVFTLGDNYRSSKDLLRIINILYKNGMEESQIKYKKLNCMSIDKEQINPYSGPAFEIIEFSAKEKNLEEYVINYILNLLTKKKEIDISKIAILTEKNYQCEIYNKLLSKYNLPTKIVNKNNIFDTDAALFLEMFLNCLINPSSLKHIILISTSKFLKSDLIKLDNIENNILIEELLKKFKIWSYELNKNGFINTLNKLSAYLRNHIFYDKDTNSNLFQLSELIEKELQINNYNIIKVCDWYKNELNPNTRKGKGDEYLIKNYSQISGINISTIHSSKGLEYDIVICPYLWNKADKTKTLKGPLWKNYFEKKIYIDIQENSKKVKELKFIEDKDLINEYERLIYVALTRAKYKLIIFNNEDETNNILNRNLLKNLSDYRNFLTKTDFNLKNNQIESLKNKFKNISFENNFWNYDINRFTSNRYNELTNNKITFRSSYSGWINKNNRTDIANNYKDYEDNLSIINNKKDFNNLKNSYKYLYNLNPLSTFPKGKNAGTCIHKILERFNFESNSEKELTHIIEQELRNHYIDLSFSILLKEGILRVLNTSLGEKLGNKKLIDIPNEFTLKEIKYDLAISNKGKVIKSDDIAECFLIDNNYDFGKNYAKKVKELKFFSKGFHTGFIDCIVPIGECINTSKWWIIDWKSNYISDKDQNKCLPKNYLNQYIKDEMIKNHYPLQSHLYLLALHRLLKWRLKGYDPSIHLGGYIYIFLRGLPDFNISNTLEFKNNIPGIYIGNAPINRINYLDNLFKNGN